MVALAGPTAIDFGTRKSIIGLVIKPNFTVITNKFTWVIRLFSWVRCCSFTADIEKKRLEKEALQAEIAFAELDENGDGK